MKTAVDAAELLSLRAADLCDGRREPDRRASSPGGEASVVTGEARKAAADAAMFAGSTLFQVCGAGSVDWRSTASTATGATPARCRCTTRSTSSPRTPATSCSTTGFRPSTPTTRGAHACLIVGSDVRRRGAVRERPAVPRQDRRQGRRRVQPVRRRPADRDAVLPDRHATSTERSCSTPGSSCSGSPTCTSGSSTWRARAARPRLVLGLGGDHGRRLRRSPRSSSSTSRRSACSGCSGRCCGGCSGWCSALGLERLTAVTGWLTLILSFTTCTIPGYLLLLGEWGHVPTWMVLAAIAATALALVPVANRTLRSAPGSAPGEVGGVRPPRPESAERLVHHPATRRPTERKELRCQSS